MTSCAVGGYALGGDGAAQMAPEDVCRLLEGPSNDNMMGSSLGYGSETEFSNALLQPLQNHPRAPQQPQNKTCAPPSSNSNDFTPAAQAFAGVIHTGDMITTPLFMLAGAAAVAGASAFATVVVCSNPLTCGLSVITAGTGIVGTGALLYGAYSFAVNETIPFFEGKGGGTGATCGQG